MMKRYPSLFASFNTPVQNEFKSFVLVLLSLLLILMAAAGTAQAKQKNLIQVGVRVSPPFVIKKDDAYSGLSIELWKHIATQLELNYQFKEMKLKPMLAQLEQNQLDVAVGAITVTSEREQNLDFTHPFHSSGLGIAVSNKHASSLAGALRAVFSVQFFQALAALITVLTVIGVLIWLLERKANPQHFGGSVSKGLGSGFWWSAVTMTTVGYGDKAPVTFWGRLLAIIWMFTSVITISGFTATIASVFTLQQITGNINRAEDLVNHTVATIAGSTGDSYADQHLLRKISVDTPDGALELVMQGKADAVVHDLPMLRHLVNTKYHGQITVLPAAIARQDYAFALPVGSHLRDPVNVILLKHIASPEWQKTINEYLGD